MRERQPRVLVTGLSGLIGSALHRHLGGRYPLRALNRRPVTGVECHQADLGDLNAIQPAFQGIDTVVHLGAVAGDELARADILRVKSSARTTSSRNNRWSYRDVEHARAVLGWAPVDSAEDFR